MVHISLTQGDLERIQFAYSPLLELTCSYRLVHRRKNPHPSFIPWLDETSARLHESSLPLMHTLADCRDYIADFITPTPDTPQTDLEAQFALMRGLSAEEIRQDIQRVISYDNDSEILRQFLAYPHEMVECLIEEMRWYWQHVLAEKWGQMRSLLEQELLYRGRQTALEGTYSMLDTLSPSLHYQDSLIQIEKVSRPHQNQYYALHGEGLQLCPVLFTGGDWVSWQLDSEVWKPMIIYQARGYGTLRQQRLEDPEAQLVYALGATRAQVLISLCDPMTTTELAHHLHMTSGAASQHLQRLRKAGLVSSQRSGQYVYYQLSERGVKLIALFQTG